MKKELIQTAFAVSMSILSLSSGKAQEVPKFPESYREVGIGFSSSTSFSLRYQWGTDQMMYRLTAVSLGATNSTANTTEVNNSPNSTQIYGYQPVVNTPINL